MADWNTYLQKTENRKPSKLLEKALLYTKVGHALDLGAGTLSESKFLLGKGFTVTAVDANETVKEYLDGAPIELVISTFDDYQFPKNKFSLINARYALPFSSPESFSVMFSRLKESLTSEGVFVGQFFGVNDDWNVEGSNKSFHTKEQIIELLRGFKIIDLIEEEKDGPLAIGGSKHWHVFNVIAKNQSS
mgnify:CR=1 FL=1